jgi:hypothetical protein
MPTLQSLIVVENGIGKEMLKIVIDILKSLMAYVTQVKRTLDNLGKK